MAAPASVYASPATAIALLLICVLLARAIVRSRKTAHIPGIRYGTVPGLRSWQGAYAWLRDPEGVLAEAYEKYPNGVFKVATLISEHIIVNDREKLSEYLAAPDAVLNVQDAINAGIQFQWTMGAGVYYRPYHIPLVRKEITQNVPTVLPSMQEEVQRLLSAEVGSPKEWKDVAIHDLATRIVAVVGNLALGGKPLAHNAEYIRTAIQYTLDLMFSAELLRPLPIWAKETFARLTPAYRSKKKCERLIGDYIQQRLDATDQGKPQADDALQMLIGSAPPVERTMAQLNERLLALNVAAIHTTSMTLSAAVYTLCAEHEKYLQPLREEVRRFCPDGNFTKDILDKLSMTDSFLRECGRVSPIGTLASGRMSLVDFKFKDGTVIPKGYIVSGSIPVLHETLPGSQPDFDGFRYSSMAEKGQKRPQMVSTSRDYLAFGYGRHACPGRFFASSEIKLIFANLILHYDMQLQPGTSPSRLYVGSVKIPETKLKILMKASGD